MNVETDFFIFLKREIQINFVFDANGSCFYLRTPHLVLNFLLERITADEATRRSRRSGRDGRRLDKDGIRSGSKFGSSRVLHVAGLTN